MSWGEDDELKKSCNEPSVEIGGIHTNKLGGWSTKFSGPN